jgi:hypothetical protein
MEKTKKNIESVSTGIGWVEKILSLSSKYKLTDFLKALFILIMIGYTTLLILNPSVLFILYDKSKEKEHASKLTQRMENTVLVKNELQNLLYISGADRAFLIEFHNSIKSVEGFPYAYGSMNYEVVKDSICYVSDEYNHFSLTKYDLIPYMLKNSMFVGSVDAIKPLDDRLYFKFLSNEVTDIAMITIEGAELPLGVLGLSYCNNNMPDSQNIKALLRKESVKIALILSNK